MKRNASTFSTTPPALESTLHKMFAHRRINLVNNRREFFQVSLDEIKEGLQKSGIEADIRTTVEAEEFRVSSYTTAFFTCLLLRLSL